MATVLSMQPENLSALPLRDIIEACYDGLYTYVYFRCGRNEDLTDEICQQTVLLLGRKYPTLDMESAAKLLRKIARDQLAQHWRQARAQWAAAPLLADLAQRVEGAQLPDEIARREETRLWVGLVLSGLDDDIRCLLDWKYKEGLSVREIAARLGKTEKAAEHLLEDARAAFKAALAKACKGAIDELF